VDRLNGAGARQFSDYVESGFEPLPVPSRLIALRHILDPITVIFHVAELVKDETRGVDVVGFSRAGRLFTQICPSPASR